MDSVQCAEANVLGAIHSGWVKINPSGWVIKSFAAGGSSIRGGGVRDMGEVYVATGYG